MAKSEEVLSKRGILGGDFLMIFVTLGTQDKPFVRLLKMVSTIKSDEEIVVQAGYTEYHDERLHICSYFPTAEFKEYMARADVVISHGGVGSLITALDMGTKVLVCPRLSRYGEHQNDHQQQIVDIFTAAKHVVELKEGCDINEELLKLADFQPEPFVHNNAAFVAKMRNYLSFS